MTVISTINIFIAVLSVIKAHNVSYFFFYLFIFFIFFFFLLFQSSSAHISTQLPHHAVIYNQRDSSQECVLLRQHAWEGFYVPLFILL